MCGHTAMAASWQETGSREPTHQHLPLAQCWVQTMDHLSSARCLGAWVYM